MRSASPIAIAAIIAAALASAAIAAPAAAAPSSRVEYGVEAGLTCAEFDDEYGQASKSAFKGKGPGNYVRFVDRFLDVFGEMTNAVALVPAAPGDEALVASWIESLRDLARLTDRTLPPLKQKFRLEKEPGGRGSKRHRILGERYKRRLKASNRALRRSRSLARELTAEGCIDIAL